MNNVKDFLLVDEMQVFNEGSHFSSYKFLGNKIVSGGYRFTVWAPNARSVSLVGDFSNWQALAMEAVSIRKKASEQVQENITALLQSQLNITV